MLNTSDPPDLASLQIPTDSWTQPFWDAAAAQKLVLPKCADCGHFRWPPGPFCPNCRAQRVAWVPSGEGRVYSYTVVSDRDQSRMHAPALIEFPDAGGLRIIAAIIDAPRASIRIGAKVNLAWRDVANSKVPVFRISES
jgi:uncharacterized OB-fold protein